VETPLAITTVDDINDGNGSTIAGYLWIEAKLNGDVAGQPGVGRLHAVDSSEAGEDGVVKTRNDHRRRGRRAPSVRAVGAGAAEASASSSTATRCTSA